MKGRLLRLQNALLASLFSGLLLAPGAQALETPEEAVRAKFQQVQTAMDRDDRDTAMRLATECLEAVRSQGLTFLMPEALLMNGEAMMGSLQEPKSRSFLLNALGLASELKDRRVLANALNDLGILCEREDQLDAAEAYYREAYAIAKTLNDPLLMDAVTYDLATMECLRGDLTNGYEHMKAVLESARSRKDQLAALKTLVRLSEIERDLTQPGQAEATAQEALKLSRNLKHALSEQGALRVLAALAAAKGEFALAESHLKSALQAANISKDPYAGANAAFELGEFFAARKRMPEAQAQFLAAEHDFRQLGRLDIADQIRDAIEKLKKNPPRKE